MDLGLSHGSERRAGTARALRDVGGWIGALAAWSRTLGSRIGRLAAGLGELRPEWRIEIRLKDRDAAVISPRACGLGVGLTLAAVAAAVTILGLGAVAHHHRLVVREATVQRVAAASDDLRTVAARLRSSLDRTRGDLTPLKANDAVLDTATGRAREHLAALGQQVRRLQQARAPSDAARLRAQADNQAAEIAQARAMTERQLRQAVTQEAALADRLARAQSALAASTQQAAAKKLALRQAQQQLRRVEIARAGGKRSRRIAAIRGTIGSVPGALGKLTHLLASTGVDVERFLARFGVQRGIGGPFIPARDAPRPLSPKQEAAFRMMLHALPLTAPLHIDYRIGSRFGDRRDPYNGRAEFHPGIDLDAPYMTPVYATAPGTVTYAGWMDGYGRMVEIDHGSGIATRYAHLHRYTVVVGQRVGAGTRIGLLGSTGRSTGPHLHYEIRVNGEPVNPQRFLRLGHEVARSPIIPIAARR